MYTPPLYAADAGNTVKFAKKVSPTKVSSQRHSLEYVLGDYVLEC